MFLHLEWQVGACPVPYGTRQHANLMDKKQMDLERSESLSLLFSFESFLYLDKARLLLHIC
jgi:hypothetical protein